MTVSSKRYYGLRFDVLERDSFTCQYCGQSAPSVPLTVDHIKPRSEGGEDTEENLITACWSCNAGKASRLTVTHLSGLSLGGQSITQMPRIGPICLEYITKHGRATSTMISKATGINQSNVSKFLNHSTLLTKEREGKNVFYSLSVG